MAQTTTTTLRLHTGGDHLHRDGSRSMILQPEDVVALTAEEAAADIENAMRAFARENRDEKEPGRRPPDARG